VECREPEGSAASGRDVASGRTPAPGGGNRILTLDVAVSSAHHSDNTRSVEMMIESADAVTALSALAHESRLGVYRQLVEAGPDGLNAGTIAARLALPASSLTFHLQHLHRAGLITQRRQGRQLIYSADFTAMRRLVGYLTENCCGGNSQRRAACDPVRKQPRRRAAGAPR